MEEKQKIQISELVEGVAYLLVQFYVTYYEHNNELIPIEKLQVKGSSEIIKTDKRYHIPIIISLLLQILKESEMADDWAAMIQLTYANSRDAGFGEYQSVMNILNNFELEFDENNFPKISVKADQAIISGDINTTIH